MHIIFVSDNFEFCSSSWAYFCELALEHLMRPYNYTWWQGPILAWWHGPIMPGHGDRGRYGHRDSDLFGQGGMDLYGNGDGPTGAWWQGPGRPSHWKIPGGKKMARSALSRRVIEGHVR